MKFLAWSQDVDGNYRIWQLSHRLDFIFVFSFDRNVFFKHIPSLSTYYRLFTKISLLGWNFPQSRITWSDILYSLFKISYHNKGCLLIFFIQIPYYLPDFPCVQWTSHYHFLILNWVILRLKTLLVPQFSHQWYMTNLVLKL